VIQAIANIEFEWMPPNDFISFIDDDDGDDVVDDNDDDNVNESC
jgi:hypothetical protein